MDGNVSLDNKFNSWIYVDGTIEPLDDLSDSFIAGKMFDYIFCFACGP